MSADTSPNRESVETNVESKIFLPANVALHIFFSGHAERSHVGDSSRFRKLIRSADVVIPERLGWTKETLANFRKIAKGDYKIYQQVRNHYKERDDYAEFNLLLISALYASYVKVAFVDVEEGPLEKQFMPPELTLGEITQGNYEEALNQTAYIFRQDSKSQMKREDYMMEQLGPRLVELIEPNPNLKKKDEVSVLMTLGADHKRLAEVLRGVLVTPDSPLPTVTCEMSESLVLDMPFLKLSNAYKSGENLSKEKEDRLVAETLALHLINIAFLPQIDLEIVTETVHDLSSTGIRELFDTIKYNINDLRGLGNTEIWQKISEQIFT